MKNARQLEVSGRYSAFLEFEHNFPRAQQTHAEPIRFSRKRTESSSRARDIRR
jgi:hypothetical protein